MASSGLDSLLQTPPAMPPPPTDAQYDSLELAVTAINDFARKCGYAVSVLRSKRTKQGIKKTVRLCCDRGRVYRPRQDASSRVRQSTTLAIECPFAISLRLQHDTNTWLITYENTSHNHGPSPASTHHIQRTLELSRKSENIHSQLRQGLTTRQVLTGLRSDDPDSCLISRDVHNCRKKLHADFLAGRTPIQALLQELPRDGDWIFKYELDDDLHVTVLFCMHKSSVAMLRSNPWVISMDCTYKTNKFNLPLLDIVGLTAISNFKSVCDLRKTRNFHASIN